MATDNSRPMSLTPTSADPGPYRGNTHCVIHPTARIHPTATFGAFCVIGANVVIGARTKIWHHVVLLADVTIGEDCMIGSTTEVGRGSTIGDRSRIGYGVFLPSHSTIGKSVFIGPKAAFADDMHPRVPGPHDPPYHAQPPVIEDFAAVGLGAVVRPGVHIGLAAGVAAGTLVDRDVAAHEMVRGYGTAGRPAPMPSAWAKDELSALMDDAGVELPRA